LLQTLNIKYTQRVTIKWYAKVNRIHHNHTRSFDKRFKLKTVMPEVDSANHMALS